MSHIQMTREISLRNVLTLRSIMTSLWSLVFVINELANLLRPKVDV